MTRLANLAYSEILNQAIFPHLISYGSIVRAAGIRYGTVAYVAFGQGLVEKHSGRADTTRYPCELEFGSDVWRLIRDGRILLDSDYADQSFARMIIAEFLVGRTVIGIKIDKNESAVDFDNDTQFTSSVSPGPASGFLCAFQAENEPPWETIDGVILQT